MLERLIIENVALIEKLDLELGLGFTVLTGETGAGKSIIIDGINLVLGGRGSKELISYGKQKCRVEAVFGIDELPQVSEKLREMELDSDDGSLTVMRELSVNGKSLCRVNGVVIPLSSLKPITDLLVDVHGQHEHQSLLDEKNHLGVIDAYSFDTIDPLIREVDGVYSDYVSVCAKLNSGFLSAAERERRIDVLNYQINEIESANIKPGEENDIKEELNVLSNAEKIVMSTSLASEKLNSENGAAGLLKRAADELSSISGFSSKLNEVWSRINDLSYELEDAAYSVRDMSEEVEFDPKRIDELETRLDALDTLKHKYGPTLTDVLDFLNKAQRELDDLTGDEAAREELEKKKAELLKQYRLSAEKLTEARKASGDKLCMLAEKELKELGMKKARLSAEFEIIDDEPHEGGSDAVRLLLSANEGEPLKPLSKVASGGELSRIMLALKTVITEADGIPTLIFDEVDSGISGITANTVGLRMKRIAGRHQVLCVTHLPQIAAFANEHYFVSKHEENGRTVTSVKKLDRYERAAELARIMGAEDGSSFAASHAEELIRRAEKAE